MTQIWLAVDKDGDEAVFSIAPTRNNIIYGKWSCEGQRWIDLPLCTIEKILGRKLTWADEAVEVNERRIKIQKEVDRVIESHPEVWQQLAED